ncbi:MAG: protein kinase [Planctomycetota bacterium]|nr:protein kinase [Planctomycetota bacterium]
MRYPEGTMPHVVPPTIGPYEVQREIGRGGMGVVYLARDTKLDRDVAIKALPEELAQDADRLARFEREAKLLASLNHPNVATIHGLEEVDGKRYLVLEYVEGKTLEDRLRSGAIGVDEALVIASQIAEAIEAAHAKGIIHRDLKPANIKFTADEHVKVLDFGLAKALEDQSQTESEIANSPTIIAGHSPTLTGVVLGTAGYLSPEQARGRPVDKRTDIFAFGCILYEMLSGKCLFAGETVSDSIGATLHKEPDWCAVQSDVPSTIQLLLHRCLVKDRNLRLQAIGDARVALQDVAGAENVLRPSVRQTQRRRPVIAALPWVVCGLLVIILLSTLIPNAEKGAPESIPLLKRELALPPNTNINWRGTRDTWSKVGFSQLLAISRDGRRIIQTVQEGRRTSLYLKEEDDFAPQEIPGTEGARGAFFSPDGQWVGFLAEVFAQSTVWKVRLPGGVPQPICVVNSPAFDATWLDNDTIVFSTDHGLRRVSAEGGEVKQLTRVDIAGGERGHHFPHAIPNTDSILFTLVNESGQHAAILSLADEKVTIIRQHATNVRFSGTGHLVFAHRGEVLAMPYDPGNPFRVVTDVVPIARGVQTTPGQGGAVVHLFATSQSGTLIYAPQADPPEPDALIWVDHDGNEQPIVTGDGSWMHQRLSPNGDAILFNRLTSDGMLDIHIYDFQRDQINPLTRTGQVYDAEWSADGRSVCFNALDSVGRSTNMIPADRSGPARTIFEGADSRPHLSQWSDDGSTLVFFDRSSRGGVWMSTNGNDGWEPLREVINTPLREAWAQISPDGQLIAYVGFDEDGRDVYVQTYPDRGALLRVSPNGGGEPRWAADSRTLYFREAGKIYEAKIVTDPILTADDLVTLPFDDVYDAASSGHQHYDLSSDGTKFLMVRHGRLFQPNTVHVIENWPSLLNEDKTP